MIVYYNNETFDITGLSMSIVNGRDEPFFECYDPVAKDIFEGKEKVSKYKVSIDKKTNRSSLILRGAIVERKHIDNLISRILKSKQETPSLTFEQNINKKTLTLIITELGKGELEYFDTDTITFAACKINDPYKLLWSNRIKLDRDKIEIKYNSIDNFDLYVYNPIGSYEHIVITSF